jgi:hypothetical protein
MIKVRRPRIGVVLVPIDHHCVALPSVARRAVGVCVIGNVPMSEVHGVVQWNDVADRRGCLSVPWLRLSPAQYALPFVSLVDK